MENTENIVMDDDIFDDADDFADMDEPDGNQTGGEEEPAEEPGAEGVEPTTEPPETEENSGEGEEKPGAEPEMFELNILGNIEKRTREETIALAQQGADYARVAQQRDAFRQFQNEHGDTIAELTSLAQSMNMDIPALLASMQTSMLVQNGMSREAAEQKVRADRYERQVNAGKQQKTQQEQLVLRQERDIQAFIQKHPNLDPKTIPQSVWDAVRSGETLVNAYDSYVMQQMQAENKQLKEQITALQQNNNNRQNSLGSMKSGGQPPKTDAFIDELFAND